MGGFLAYLRRRRTDDETGLAPRRVKDGRRLRPRPQVVSADEKRTSAYVFKPVSRRATTNRSECQRLAFT